MDERCSYDTQRKGSPTIDTRINFYSKGKPDTKKWRFIKAGIPQYRKEKMSH